MVENELLQKIKVVDLFCGVGGLTHGLEDVGLNVVAGIDLDKSCEFAYTNNNKSSFVYADIKEITSEQILEFFDGAVIKVLVGCAPCQPFSKLQKNKQEKNEDSKWGLLYTFMHHIEYIKPQIVSMENVPSLRNEVVFKDFVQNLKKLNYHVSYQVVDASDYGVPQRRKRLILLASQFGEISLIEPTTSDHKVTVREAIGFLPPISSGGVDSNDSLHRSANLSEKNLKRIRESKPGGTWKDWDKSLLPDCYNKESGKTFMGVYGRINYDDVSPTLTTQFYRYGTGRYGHPTQDRALSLREGAILQSFPSDYNFCKDDNISMTTIGRQIGNAVPVKLGEAIGKSIINHLAEAM